MFSHSVARIVVAGGTVRFFTNIHMKKTIQYLRSRSKTPYQQSVKQAHSAFFASVQQRDIIMQTEHVCVCVYLCMCVCV